MSKEITIAGLDDLDRAAAEFVGMMDDRTVYAFHGPMGAGKTTFIAEVCRRLGVGEIANSPSFSIINEYVDARGEKIYHFDFYRFESPQEAEEIGAEDYFYSGNLCLIEWPERVEPLLPPDTVVVNIAVGEDGERIITF